MTATVTTELIPIEKKVEQGIADFDQKKQEFEQLAASCKGLKVSDINNNKELEIISKARKSLKAARVTIEKQGKSLRDTINEIKTSVSEKEKQLIAIIEPVEDELQAEEDRVTNERERIRKEKEEAKNAIIAARVKQLIDLGCAFDGSRYSLGEKSLAHIVLAEMPDEYFQSTLLEYSKVAEQIEAQRLEDERLRVEAEEAERKRIAAEQEQMRKEREELERLRKEQQEREEGMKLEQERLRKEQEGREEELRKERERIEAEKRELERQRIEAITIPRIADLKGMGLVENHSYYYHPLYDCTSVDKNIISAASKEDWEEAIALLTQRIDEGKQAEESKRLAEMESAKEKARQEEAARIEAENRRKQEEQEAHERELAKEAALRPDKDKLISLADSFGNIQYPALSSDGAITILNEVKELVAKIQRHIHRKVKAL